MKHLKLFENFITESQCQQYSDQEMADMSNKVENGLIEIGIEETDFKDLKDPDSEMKSKIQELKEIHKNIKEDITRKDLKDLIREIKKMKKNAEEGGVSESLNEQSESIKDALKPILEWFSKLPKGLLIGIAIWYIFKICRCFIYKLESRLFGCGLSWKRSVLGRITQFLLLDFKTLTDPDDTTIFCFHFRIGRSEEY